MIEFTKVTYQDFLSIGDAEVEIRNGLFVILGTNNDDPADANGAGKSSLIEGFIWCLYGRTLRSIPINKVINRYVNKPSTFVTIEFNSNKTKYMIQRIRKKSSTVLDLFAWKNNEWDCISDGTNPLTQKLIDNIIGKDFDFFIRTQVFTSDTKSFCAYTDGELKNFFRRVLNLDKWDDYKKQTKSKLSELNEGVSRLRYSLEDTSGSVLDNNTAISICSDRIKELMKLDWKSSLAPCESKLKLLEEKLEESSSNKDSIVKLAGQLNAKRKSIMLVKKESDDMREIWHSVKRKLDSLKMDVINNDNMIQEKRMILSLAKCRHCGKPNLDDAESIVQMISDLGDDSKERQSQTTTLEIEEVSAKKKYETSLANLNVFMAEISKYEIKLNSLKREPDESEVIKSSISTVKIKIEGIKSKMAEHDGKIIACNERMKMLKADKGKLVTSIQETEKKIKKNGYISEVYTNLMKTFSDIKVSLMNGVVEPINQQANIYLNSLGVVGYTLKFQLGTDDELDSSSNAFDIKLIEELTSTEIDYHSYSGGEKKRIDMALVLSLLSITASKSDSNIIFKDEILDAVDATGVTAILETLEDMAKDKSIWVVSHNPTTKELFGNIIQCTKTNRITSVEVELDEWETQ
jgi:DNA repair exonuclease SbcCD ATPase subunit